jgi:hypothetical protein
MTETITLLSDVVSAEPRPIPYEVKPVDNASSSGRPGNGRRRVPFFIPASQAYYWSSAWQDGEDHALREIGMGNMRSFRSGAEAAAWLLADGD